MTKADQIILDNTLTNKQKYNKLLEMWEQGKNYSQIHTLSTEQYERFAEIPIHLSALLELIEPDPRKRTKEEVFGGFKNASN